MEDKPGVTKAIRSMAKSNIDAEAKTRRRVTAIVGVAVLAVCVWAFVHWVL